MPFALLIIGAVLLTAAVRNTQSQLYSLVLGDFTGPANFVFWVFSLLVIGAVGYIPKLKPISVAFMTLVILVLFLKRGNPANVGGGFFTQLTSALNTTQTQTSTIPLPQLATNTTLDGSPSSSTIPLPELSPVTPATLPTSTQNTISFPQVVNQ